MSYTFEKPVGAAMDVRELEYITALHQTQHADQDAFRDASIEPTDVKNYLMSRYGIQVSKEKILDLIFHDLAGSNNIDESLDIPEIVAILLIPYLRKVSMLDMHEDDEVMKASFVSKFEKEAFLRKRALRRHDLDSNIIGKVLNVILAEATGSDEPQPLTTDLLRRIFETYDEKELAEDESLLKGMIAVAMGDEENAILDTEAFSRALTSDIDEYNEELETKFTTHYEDVFGLVTVEKDLILNQDEQGEEQEGATGPVKIPSMYNSRDEVINGDFQRVFVYSQIDYLADSFRDKTQYILVWLAVIFGYIAYFNPFDSYGIQVCKEENRDEFICEVAQSITVWFAILGVMLCVMVPAVLILSLGNNIHRHSPLEIAGGIVGIVLLIFFPAFYPSINNRFLKTATDPDAPWAYTLFRVINTTLGCMLLFFQFCNIVRWIVPDSKLRENKFLTLVLRGSGVRSEFGIKQAAIKKVHNMVKHAYDLYLDSDQNLSEDNKNERPSSSKSLLKYMRLAEKRETYGGFFWAWKSFFTDHLIEEEGVWIHTRLLAANMAQFIISFGAAIFAFFIGKEIIEELYPPEDVPQNNRCGSYVDPAQCSFPTVPYDGTELSIGMGICQNVRLTNTTCLQDFIAVPAEVQEQFCGVISDSLLMPDFNTFLDTDGVEQYLNYEFDTTLQTCPDLYIPYPSEILTAFEGSTANDFCVAPITACTPTGENSDGQSQGNCLIGNQHAFPFQFFGEACANYTVNDFDILHVQRMEYVETVDDYWPTENTLYSSFGIGIISTLLAGLVNTAVSIPSQIITTLKYRMGVIETLRDKQFLRYRTGMLNLTFLLGAFVWGGLVLGAVVFVMVTSIAFFFLYHVTRPYVLWFIAVLIGVSTTLLAKLLVSLLLNKYSFIGFYRKRPVLANIANVAFECWHLAVTVTFVIIRAVKLIVVVIVNLGRFDRPILAKGVGDIGPIALDNFPNIFAKDLLATDAHRHPYIERLGMMYLMKLKHGDKFARRTGSIWRLLFVFALMPYLRKNRIAAITTAKD